MYTGLPDSCQQLMSGKQTGSPLDTKSAPHMNGKDAIPNQPNEQRKKSDENR